MEIQLTFILHPKIHPKLKEHPKVHPSSILTITSIQVCTYVYRWQNQIFTFGSKKIYLKQDSPDIIEKVHFWQYTRVYFRVYFRVQNKS